ncbi:hypothetical protein QQ045_012609 [Rhodiola kirilowii]
MPEMLGLLSRNMLITTADTLISPHAVIFRKRSNARLFATAEIRAAKRRDESKSTDDAVAVASTVSYLVGSCGLTSEAAERAAKRFRLQSADTADGVLALFKDYGFSDGHISSIVQRRPVLLLADPEKTLI